MIISFEKANLVCVTVKCCTSDNILVHPTAQLFTLYYILRKELIHIHTHNKYKKITTLKCHVSFKQCKKSSLFLYYRQLYCNVL